MRKKWILAALVAASLVAQPIDDLHKQVLHTQVRVRTEKGGGSGTVVYSEASGGFFNTYAITCHHVIDSALRIETKWDPLLQRDRKQEARSPVQVEFFSWAAVPHGKPPLTSGALAEVAAYDARHDVALLFLRLAQRPTVATSLPLARVKEVQIGTVTWAVGCALLHDPIMTNGIITHMGDIIDYADYWMSNSQIIYGNSGGGMFVTLGTSHFFVGLPSRVAVAGWGTVVTHMGYFSPITRVYDFYREQIFDFLIPGSNRTEAQCEVARKARKEAEQKRLLLITDPSKEEKRESDP